MPGPSVPTWPHLSLFSPVSLFSSPSGILVLPGNPLPRTLLPLMSERLSTQTIPSSLFYLKLKPPLPFCFLFIVILCIWHITYGNYCFESSSFSGRKKLHDGNLHDIFFCSLFYSQQWHQCLTHCRHSVNIYWISRLLEHTYISPNDKQFLKGQSNFFLHF